MGRDKAFNTIGRRSVILGLIVLFTLLVGLIFFQNASRKDPQITSVASSANTTQAIDSFRASGMVASVVSPSLYATYSAGNMTAASVEVNMLRPPPPPPPNDTYFLDGNWSMGVSNGGVQFFTADFDMANLNGSRIQAYSITNFSWISLSSSQGASKVALDNQLNTNAMGFADIYRNGSLAWKHVATSISLERGNAIDIRLDQRTTDNHFGGLPILGTVNSIIDPRGKQIEKPFYSG